MLQRIRNLFAARQADHGSIFSLQSSLNAVRQKIIDYANIILLTSVVLGICILVFYPIDGVALWQHPALFATIAFVGITLFALKSQNVRLSLLLTLMTGFVLLCFMLVLDTSTERASIWAFQFVIFAYLLVGIRQGLIWLVLTGLLLVGLSGLSALDIVEFSLDGKLIITIAITAAATTIVFAVHDNMVHEYFSAFEQANTKLAEENARRYAVIDALADGIITADKNGKINYVNEKATKLLGIETIEQIEGIVGQNLIEHITLLDIKGNVIPPENRPEIQVLQTGKHINTENEPMSYKMQRTDGSSFPVETAISPVRTGSNNYGIIQIFRDITWQQQINQAKDEFVSLASHQLNTPLASIKWNCEMLMWPENYKLLQEPQRKILYEMNRSAIIMSELVGDLLNISRLELGTLSFDMQKVDITEIGRETIENSQRLIDQKKDVTFKAELGSQPQWIQADRRFVRMIFDNLLSNSIKYTSRGLIDMQIFSVTPQTPGVEGKIRRNGVIMALKDTGVGIPQAQQDQIFSKLFRADNVKTTNVGGTGLGLYLVFTTLQRMGGTIWFDSKENVGTNFYVYFPHYSENT